ncbi:MAG: HAD-IIIA family hydrolase [Chitinophagaceae bacterium]|jgi:histidinol-phosphate phosphatase family protein|nr:HAD-IIIA family hydrolase [Chitinophagaceae bacterium]
MPIRFDKTWTLFLDRDGVINIEKENDYIHQVDEFIMYPGVSKAISRLSHLFRYVIVVTNQKGIGKGVTLEENVKRIHEKMVSVIVMDGGRIDGVYYCPDSDETSPCRKPNTGMAMKAKADFPGIDFEKSLMVGNNVSDLLFGRNSGMKTAFLRTTQPDLLLPENLSDFEAADLPSLANNLASLFVDC